MKFWIDEIIPRPLGKALEQAGYKVSQLTEGLNHHNFRPTAALSSVKSALASYTASRIRRFSVP